MEFRKGGPEGTSDHRLSRSGADGFGTPRESASHHWKPGSPKTKPEVLETPGARVRALRADFAHEPPSWSKSDLFP